METAVLTTTQQLEAIEREWLDLWRELPDATPFQSPMWLLPWWRHFGSNDLATIAVRDDDGRLRALAPLYVVRDGDESLGMFLGTGISDYLDVLGTDSSVVSTLQKIDCQMWDLQQLRPHSPVVNMPLPDGWSANIEEHDTCVLLSIANAGDELENLLSTHARKKIRYYTRALDCTFEDANAENIDTLLDALFELHAARWQRRGMPGMLADEVIQRFHRDVARAMLNAGALRMYAMRSAGRIAAVFYGFAHGDTVSYYLSGYDPELEKHSPGTVIVAHAIAQAVREGASTFDFLRGAEDYKYSWGGKDRVNFRRQLWSAAGAGGAP
jgi:CelD/BcsL family acetyltransferase involved in cellulose biosynthesis